MNYFQAVILSIIEGLSEFLPISSTGHLILASDILKISQTEFAKSFEIIIQLGAIISIVFLYRKTLIRNLEYWKKILVAFIPTGILGFTLYKLVKHYLLGNSLIVIISLFIGGIILILLEKFHQEKNSHTEKIENLSYKNAVIIGLFQSVSMIPGVSRSAATIIGGVLMGLNRKTAVEFSFILAVPTMLAATGLDLVKSNFQFSDYEYSLLGVGFIGAFFTAIIAVKLFISFVQKNTFVHFGVYRIVIALLFWLFMLK